MTMRDGKVIDGKVIDGKVIDGTPFYDGISFNDLRTRIPAVPAQ